MGRSCAICKNKTKNRCDYCGNEFCHVHSIKCDSCGMVVCIRELNESQRCPTCGKTIQICPECLYNGELVSLIASDKICPECGWSQ